MTAPTCTGISNNYHFPVIKNTGKKQNSRAYIMHVHIKPLFIPGTPNTKKYYLPGVSITLVISNH